MMPTLRSLITDISWSSSNSVGIFTISFSDGSFAMLNSSGNSIRVTAQSLFNQSVLANVSRFWEREHIQKTPINSKFKSDLQSVSWLHSSVSGRLLYFTGLDIQNLDTTVTR